MFLTQEAKVVNERVLQQVMSQNNSGNLKSHPTSSGIPIHLNLLTMLTCVGDLVLKKLSVFCEDGKVKQSTLSTTRSVR